MHSSHIQHQKKTKRKHYDDEWGTSEDFKRKKKKEDFSKQRKTKRGEEE